MVHTFCCYYFMCVSLLPACTSVQCACAMAHISKNVFYFKVQVPDRHYVKTIWDRRVVTSIAINAKHTVKIVILKVLTLKNRN